MSENKNIIIFGDSAGRLLIGDKVNETETQVSVTQPHIVDIHPQEGGQMGIRFIPSSYLELFEDGGNGTWDFPKSTHSFNNLVVSEQAVALYVQILEVYEKTRMSLNAEIQESADNVVSMTD
jgi:hypothetical protein